MFSLAGPLVVLFAVVHTARTEEQCVRKVVLSQTGDFRLNIPEEKCTVRLEIPSHIVLEIYCNNVVPCEDHNRTNYVVVVLKPTEQQEEEKYCLSVVGSSPKTGLVTILDRLFTQTKFLDLKIAGPANRTTLESCIIRSRTKQQIQTRNSVDRSLNIVGECGLVKKISSRIVGGAETVPNNYPWMVVIVKLCMSGRRILCGGSILNHRYILTAGHCAYEAKQMRVYLGVHRLNEIRTRLNVETILIHPEYKFPFHDLALLKVDQFIPFSSKVAPVCLPTPFGDDDTLPHDKVIGLGWGRTSQTSISNVLKENLFSVISDEDCAKTFGPLDSSILCTQDSESDSICQGDSGSSVGNFHMGRFVQYAVVSFTTRSCFKGKPTGYTEIRPHINWILDNTREEEEHDPLLDMHMLFDL